MDDHHDICHDRKAAARQTAWVKEWDLQLSKLPQEKREAIGINPMHPAADGLDEIVEKILCRRGEL